MSDARSPLRSLASSSAMRREAAALGLYRLAEFGPWVAMLVYAYAQGGATATGVVSLALLAPTALAALFAGPLIDRFGASRVLLGAYLAQGAAMGATAASLLGGAPAPVSYGFGALTAICLVATHPAHAVVSPGIARTAGELVALNAVTGWILSVGLVVAPACAGLILAVSTPGAVYAAGALCAVVAAILVLPLRDAVPPLPTDVKAPVVRVLRDLEDGARELARATAPREVVLVLAATFLMVGALDVLMVVLAVGTLDIGQSGAGYLTAAHGAGAVLGAAASLTLVGRSRIVPVMLVSALVAAAAFIALGLSISVGAAFAVAAVTGISRSLLEVTGQTLLQRVTPTAILARVFAFKEGLAMAAWGVGSLSVPIVIAFAGVRGALFFAGAIVPVVVGLRLRQLLAVDTAATVPAVTIALLRSVGIFRALPVPAIEGIAHSAVDRPMSAGETIVREGEVGDCYYAIADGTVEVRSGETSLSSLGRGDGFGEVALVHDVPRTATVVASSNGRLLEVERDVFLVAVTGHAPTRDRAESIAHDRRSATAERLSRG